MSDEKKREELKAKINDELDELSLEDLEKVAGGDISDWLEKSLKDVVKNVAKPVFTSLGPVKKE